MVLTTFFGVQKHFLSLKPLHLVILWKHIQRRRTFAKSIFSTFALSKFGDSNILRKKIDPFGIVTLTHHIFNESVV